MGQGGLTIPNERYFSQPENLPSRPDLPEQTTRDHLNTVPRYIPDPIHRQGQIQTSGEARREVLQESDDRKHLELSSSTKNTRDRAGVVYADQKRDTPQNRRVQASVVYADQKRVQPEYQSIPAPQYQPAYTTRIAQSSNSRGKKQTSRNDRSNSGESGPLKDPPDKNKLQPEFWICCHHVSQRISSTATTCTAASCQHRKCGCCFLARTGQAGSWHCCAENRAIPIALSCNQQSCLFHTMCPRCPRDFVRVQSAHYPVTNV